jgi:DNA-binding XRE family transcriptional regulator
LGIFLVNHNDLQYMIIKMIDSITPEQSRAARGLLDWSQSDLAEMAEISRQTIVDFERGARRPQPRSLKAMQETFERHGIQFTESKTEGIGVKLRSSIWQLSPVDPSSLNWKASIYCGDLIIRAASERRAREIAGLALAIAVGRVPGGNTITNPWNRLVAEATCERLSKSAYEEDGPDAILSPEEYDEGWPR